MLFLDNLESAQDPDTQALTDGYLSREAGWVESGEAVRLLALEAGRRGVEIVRDRATAVVARGGRVQGARLEGRGV